MAMDNRCGGFFPNRAKVRRNVGTEIGGRQGQHAGEGEPGPDNPEDKTKIPLGVAANPQDSRFSATASLLPA